MPTTFNINAAATAILNGGTWQGGQEWHDIPPAGVSDSFSAGYMAIRFDSFPEQYKRRSVTSVRLKFGIKASGVPTDPYSNSTNAAFYVFRLTPDYTGSVPSPATQLLSDYTFSYISMTGLVSIDQYIDSVLQQVDKNGWLNDVLTRGVAMRYYGGNKFVYIRWSTIYGAGSSKAPYLEVTVDDEDAHLEVSTPSPASGYYNPAETRTFSWRLNESKTAYDISGLTSGQTTTFQWKNPGGDWNDVDIADNATSYTAPANTFPTTGPIVWRTKVVDGSGYTTYTDESTLDCYRDITFTSAAINPSSGFIQEKQSKVFTFSYGRSATDYGDLFLRNSTFAIEWKTDSSAAATITGNSSSVTVPANTFPQTGAFQARAKLTNPNGVTTYSGWNTYTTDEPLSTATAVSPSNTVESDEEDVLFEWRHYNSAGTVQSGATLQWSTNGTSWQALATISGSSQTANISLSGKPAGTIYWRVATRNSDNVLGSYSAAASFVFIAAPAPPAVSMNPWPKARIQWQSAEQQAYKITVDGVEVITAFGNATSYSLLEALPDGEHTVTVSVQGQFGLWSAPAAVTFTVENITDGEIVLTGESGADTTLIWTDTKASNHWVYYDVYRDGELIARLEQLGNAQGSTYIDRYANGKHTYKVRRSFAYYTDSNEITLTGGSCETVIGAIDGVDYIPLKLTDTADTAQSFSWRKTAVSRHFEGAEYPVVETSDFSERYASYTVAFTDAKTAEAFEALRGKTVIVKSRAREMMVGVLTEFEKRVGNFYITYSFSIRKIHTPKIDNRRE